MSIKSSRAPLGALVFALASMAQAAGVVDVAPASLPHYLRTYPQVVVEYNSPDPRCGFCGKAVDAAFQDFSNRFGSDIRFVRVQWVPWSSIPPEVTGLGVGGVPMHQVFRNGILVNQVYGKIQKPDEFAATVKALFPPGAAVQPASVPVSSPPAPAATPVTVASPAAGLNPVTACPPAMLGTAFDDIPWNVNGADATWCGQTAVGFYSPDFTKGIAAFKRRNLVGLRDYRVPPVHHTWGAGMLSNDRLVASGYTETPGELWWGLFDQPASGMRHVAVGQETFSRWMASLQGTNMARAADLALGRSPVPFPRSPEAAYAFVDATPVTSSRYLGGRGRVADGQVTRADLSITTVQPIHGEMTVQLEIEGVAHSLTIPLKRNVLETLPNQVLRGSDMHQLVAGRNGGGTVVDCVEQPTSTSRSPCTFHLAGSPAGSLARYEAQGFFFGPQSDFVVITYTLSDLWWSGQNGPRSNGASSGLIVFRAR